MAESAARARMLSPDDLAEYLGVSVATVYQWNHHGTGPTPIPVGKHVRYRGNDVERWLDERQRGHRSAR